MKKLKALALLTAVAVLSNVLVLQTALADDSEIVTGTVTGGSLAITDPAGNTALEGKTTSGSTQTTTGTVTDIQIDDNRGTGVGWTASSTSTYLGLTGASAVKAETGASITSVGAFVLTGVYNGLNPQSTWSATGANISGTFSVTVNTVDSNLPATVTVTAPDASTSTPTVTAGVFTTNGLTITANIDYGNWTAADTFTFRVDAHAYTQLTNTPATLSAVNTESVSNMNLQSGAAYTGSGATSSSRNDLIASNNGGMGSFQYHLGLSQVIHGNPMAGNYQATLTLTVA